MKLSSAVLTAAVLSSFSTFAAASSSVGYGDTGVPAPLTELTATSTGAVDGYFVNASAVDNDTISLWDVTSGTHSAYFFSNHSTAAGTMANFGNVTAGDELVFMLFASEKNDYLYSDASNTDGFPHSYITPFAGGVISGTSFDFPAGTYVGFEDLLASQNSDFDYNDDNFIFTNVSGTSATPEPASLALLGTGALGAVAMLRRRAR